MAPCESNEGFLVCFITRLTSVLAGETDCGTQGSLRAHYMEIVAESREAKMNISASVLSCVNKMYSG